MSKPTMIFAYDPIAPYMVHVYDARERERTGLLVTIPDPKRKADEGHGNRSIDEAREEASARASRYGDAAIVERKLV